MKKHILSATLLAIMAFIVGCASAPGPASTYSYASDQKTTTVTLSAPNISALHKPPFNYGVAYIKVYNLDEVCEKKKTLFGEMHIQAKPIGEIYVSKAEKTRTGQLPIGNIVIQSGLDVQGPGAKMTCDRYFQFTSKENASYEIEVLESRPLVTSCTVSIKEKNPDGSYSPSLSNLAHSTKGGFLGMSRDMSPICDNR